MVLESCMILLDNSEYMRNGDYVPSRLEAQHDAANFLVGTKTQSNPENTVGVIAMCGSGTTSDGASAPGELLVSPTDDMGKILSALHGIPVRKGSHSNRFTGGEEEKKGMDCVGQGGGVDLVVSLQVANLALKHRRNKNGAQRVIVFVGSPLTHVDARALSKAGRMLKKNNLSIDVIAMGELEVNEPKLKQLVDAANGGASDDSGVERTCHLVTIPAGVLPSDVLVSSPIVNGGSGEAGGGGGVSAGGASSSVMGGAGFAEFGGVDPNLDPELAMALRVSMEEERARQERAATAAAASAQDDNNEASDSNNNDTTEGGEGEAAPMEVDGGATSTSVNIAADSDEMGFEVSEDDALLQQALAMSMAAGNDNDDTAESPPVAEEAPAPAAADVATDVDMDDEDEDAAMQLALQMSMQPDNVGEEAKKSAESASSSNEGQQQFQDPQFVNQLLGSLPGVDTNDPELNSALRNMLDKKDGDDNKDDEKK